MSSRGQLLIVLGVGLLVITITQFGAIAQRCRDFGRRRALGATRSAFVLLVIVQTATAAIIGAAIGSCAGTVFVIRVANAPPPTEFTVGVALLSLLTATLAAVPPGLAAAYQDPVRILRAP
jgi:putative ABC transport system permease protein